MHISINTHTHTQTHTHAFLVLVLGPKMSKAAPVSENTNTQQAQIVKTVDSQTFYWVLILEGKDHRLNLNTC